MKAKHSKYKTTGILFELLVRQITTDTINGVNKSPAIQIIKEIKNKYNIENFFKTKVENYSENASIYCLFENKTNPSQSVRFRFNLVETVMNKRNKVSRIDETYQMYSKQDKELKN